MIIFPQLFIALAIPTTLGYAFINFLYRHSQEKLPFPFMLTLSYGLGMGFLGQWMLLLGISPIDYTSLTIGLPLLLIAIFLFIRHRPSRISLPKIHITDWISTLLIIYITYNIVFVFWRDLNVPIFEWDAISTVALKAKVFFYKQTLYHHSHLPKSSYPLQVPFAMTWIAFNLGEWNEQLVKIIFPFIFLSYLIIHYTLTKLYTSTRWALASIALLLSANFFTFHATIAYRDFTLLYYNCTTILLLLLWTKKDDIRLLILAGLFAGFTTFTKLEGSGYLFVHTILILFVLVCQKRHALKQSIKEFLTFCAPAYTICLFYYAYKFLAEVSTAENRFHAMPILNNLERVTIILKEFSINLFLSGNWNIIWLLLILSLWPVRKLKKHFEIQFILLSLCLYFGLHFCIALGTTNFISIAGKESPTVLSRIILHFFPLAPLLLIFCTANTNKERMKIA